MEEDTPLAEGDEAERDNNVELLVPNGNSPE